MTYQDTEISTENNITNVEPSVNICQEGQVCNPLCKSNQSIILQKLITGENGWLSININPNKINVDFHGINNTHYSINIT